MSAYTHQNKRKLLFIYPGSVYGLEDEIFKRKYHLLRQYFDGYIFVKSGEDKNTNIDNFLLFAISEKKKFSSLFVFLKIIKTIKKNEIDYIICYDPLISGLMGTFLKAYLRAKLIVEVNGVYTSEAVWFEYKNSFKSKIKKKIAPRIMKFVLNRADGIKLLFKEQIDSLEINKKQTKISVFHDYVPLTFFNNLGEEKEVLIVGFPLYIKGVDILIESFKKIAHKHPDWRLKILGHYPDTTELYKYINGHPQIYHHPPVHHRDIPDHIGRCGILALPSRTEAMGRVLLEAAAAKKARIASNVDGIPSVVEHGVDGILVTPGDISELSRNLDNLISNHQLRERLSQAAFQRVYSQLSEQIYLEKYISLLEEVCIE